MDPPAFNLFGAPHLTAIGLTLAVPAGLSLLVRRARSEAVTRAVCVCLACLLGVDQIVRWGHVLHTQGAAGFVMDALPLEVCTLAVFLSIAVLLLRAQLAFELAWFWGMAGTLNAVVTPDLVIGFPRYEFFQFFISHGGVVATALFAVFGLGMRPAPGAVWRAFLWLNGVVAVVAVANQALGSNYMFLSSPPVTASPFIFLAWPWYLVVLEALALVFFALLYLPFRLAGRKEQSDDADGVSGVVADAGTRR